ncbi:hypothetical protein BS50DRAFT_27988 [Corynespora cassiicola Philippines]|uniref:Uncharacterized protein n=1 Tax=Corynespora cassiicola Philippines TaxID=1448308 RepID=A0A2T2PBD9_CORCC|nr:hypothetical protein BS50DRAFT_27988 [Corynespora cassiicola Philippines]
MCWPHRFHPQSLLRCRKRSSSKAPVKCRVGVTIMSLGAPLLISLPSGACRADGERAEQALGRLGVWLATMSVA